MPTRNFEIITEQEKKNIGAAKPANSTVLSSFTLLGRHTFRFLSFFNYTMLRQIFLVESLSHSKHNWRKFSAASRGGSSTNLFSHKEKEGFCKSSLSRHHRTGAFFAFSATKPRDEHLKKARRRKSSNPLATKKEKKKKNEFSFWHSLSSVIVWRWW